MNAPVVKLNGKLVITPEELGVVVVVTMYDEHAEDFPLQVPSLKLVFCFMIQSKYISRRVKTANNE